jgi:isocitrate/methylisocitrate lyase
MATPHQRFVGAHDFDRVAEKVVGEGNSTGAIKGSTEEARFNGPDPGTQ